MAFLYRPVWEGDGGALKKQETQTGLVQKVAAHNTGEREQSVAEGEKDEKARRKKTSRKHKTNKRPSIPQEMRR